MIKSDWLSDWLYLLTDWLADWRINWLLTDLYNYLLNEIPFSILLFISWHRKRSQSQYRNSCRIFDSITSNLPIMRKAFFPILIVLFTVFPITYSQEPITRRVQLPYTPVTAFSQTDVFLVYFHFEFRPPQEPQWPDTSTHWIFNWFHHLTERLKRKTAISFLTYARPCRLELIYFAEKEFRNRPVCKNAVTFWLSMGVARSQRVMGSWYSIK